MGKNYSNEEVNKRFEEVMEQVKYKIVLFLIIFKYKFYFIYKQFDLKKCEHNLIGYVKDKLKGLSGRERKRLQNFYF